MKNKMFNKVLSALLALVLCVGMVPAAAMPAAAADLGSSEWVVRNDGFEDYAVGEDTFWKNERYTGFSSSHHGAYGSDSYATYGIVEEADGNKVLELVSMNTISNFFDLPKISGAWSVSMDLWMPKTEGGNSVPGISLAMFTGISPSLPGSANIYVEPYGFRLVDYFQGSGDANKREIYIQNADGSTMTLPYETWYTLKASVEPGKLTLKAWPKGEEEPGDTTGPGVYVFEHEAFTEERLNSGMTASITNRNRNKPGEAYTTRIDNLKITKPYDTVTLPTGLSGQSGQRLHVNTAFTGQDLNAQVPAPRFEYTLSDPDLGHVTPDGYLALGSAGSGTLTVKAVDMDGKDAGATWDIPLTVTAAAQGDEPMRILSIGNDYSRDTLYYLGYLAELVGKDVEFAYLNQKEATLRYHAHNAATKTADYSYYKSNSDGTVTQAADAITLNEAVESENWDVIVLQQGGAAVGMNNTFAGDLRYLLDYLADAQPDAKVYWNMNAADQQNSVSRDDDILDAYYDGSQAAMYNAIVGTLEMFIVGADAEYANDFDGWFPVGAAIQNLRATAMGDTLTRDGHQLSLQAGRLAAAMTVLKVLFPDVDLSTITPEKVSDFLVTDKTDEGAEFSDDPGYTNDAANMSLIRQSVEAACSNLNAAPARVAYSPKNIESATGDANDVTVGQTEAPLNLRFADIVVTSDGTVYAGAYESVTHVPARGTLPYTEYCPEGYGRLKIWKSTDNGRTWDFDEPILTIDQHELDDWGVSPGLYDRYERLKSGSQDYAFFNDARDANLGLMYYDMDGDNDEDEVLLFTFFCNDYNESGSSTFRGTFLMHSIDGGESWSIPQRIVSKDLGNGGGKRGDIAVFSDGQILFPMYSHPHVAGVLLQWNVQTQQWDTVGGSEIPNYVPEKTTDFTEPSFIAPDPDGDTVYGFVRDNGQAVVSYDRGRTWEHIHTIDGNVQQPGWAYIDENRAFATWSFSNGGVRPTKGQMVYFDAGWEATQPTVVHDFYNPVGRDTGDPSAKLLQNGKLLTITYDTYFRSINGRFLDPEAPEFQIPELYSGAAEVTLYEATPDSASITLNKNLPSTHTVGAVATFAAGSKLTVTAANGAVVEFAAGEYGIEADVATELRVAVVGKATYVKAWAKGTAEPEDWTAVSGGTEQNNGKAVFAGSGSVTLSSVKLTRRATLIMEEGETVITGMSGAASLSVYPADMADQVTWSVSDPDVASVSGQGQLAFKQAGSVTVTAKLGDKSVSAHYEVEGTLPDEVSGEGSRQTLFIDDFEDYTAGEDAFISQMTSHGYAAMSSSDKVMKTGYHIVQENGNKYLELWGDNGLYAWCVVDTPISGDYTVQFDFYHPADSVGKGNTFLNLWQGTDVYAMVQMDTGSFQVQHIDAETGMYMNSKQYDDYGVDAWYTMKVARTDGGVYAKVWLQGTAEPEYWQFCALAEEMTTKNTAKFRFSSAAGEDETRSVRIDNIIITKQKEAGTPEWIVRSEDFSDRTVGTDKFWKDSKYTFEDNSSYRSHKVKTGTVLFWDTYTTYYSRYNIVSDNGDRMVELVSDYDVANKFTATKISGSYSATMDLYMPTPEVSSDSSHVPGVILNMFEGASPALSGSVGVYIDGGDGVRLVEHISTGKAVETYVLGADGKKMPFKLDAWYTVKMSVEPGKFTVKAWPRGDVEPADGSATGVVVFENEVFTQAMLANGLSLSVMTRTRSNKASYTVRMDNLKLAKPYESMGLPAELVGEPGEKVTLTPAFTGQNLLAQSPAPTIRYSTFGSGAADVTDAGVVTFADKGEGKVLVELLDMDGKSHGSDWEIKVKVNEPEPEPEPEPEYPDHMGYFSLEVVKTLIINGEEVQICRWVWTPFNKK